METAAASLSLCQAARPKSLPTITNSRLPNTSRYCSRLSLQPSPNRGSKTSSSLEMSMISLKQQQRFVGHHVVVGCVSSSSSTSASAGLLGDLERELELELLGEQEGEWMRERCKGRKGMVELLECLETEAIMGEDQGKDPTDYNRRAQIFDKSSRVFQALKAQTTPLQQS